MFENETSEAIMERMLSKFPSDIDKREGSVVWDFLSPTALELEQAYQQLDLVVNWFYTNENSPREILIAKCADVGIEPKEAVPASGYITISGQEGALIPSGTRISTDDDEPVYFFTKNEVTIPTSGTIEVLVEAETPGTIGNVKANKIVRLITDVEGIASLTNSTDFNSGISEEPDHLLYQRYRERVSTRSSSGNHADYIHWAKEVPGIGYARVFRTWNGPGTLRVVVATYDKRSPSPSLLERVEKNIEKNKPDLADVTVDGVEELSIDIDAKLTLVDDADEVKVTESIQVNINEYLGANNFNEQIVRYSKIAEAILNGDGVIDYADLRINNTTGNILLREDQIAILGKVNIIKE